MSGQNSNLFLGTSEAYKRRKAAESSREFVEKTRGKPLPNPAVQMNFSEVCLLSAFVSPDILWLADAMAMPDELEEEALQVSLRPFGATCRPSLDMPL